MMNRIESRVYALLAAMAVCFAIGSCSGEDNNSKPEVPADPDALCTITPHEISISPVDASQTPITRSATGEPEQKATYAENLGVNFSAEATLEAVPQDAQTRAGSILISGTVYRIVAFNRAGAIVGNVVYRVAGGIVEGKELKLQAGTYRLFAYTFNSLYTVRDLDADKKNVTVNSGEDFMTYTDDNYIVSSTDYSSGKQFNISFVRQCARLTVRIIAEAYTDNVITDAYVTIGNVFGSGSKWNATTNTDASSILPSVAGTASLVKATVPGSTVDCGPSRDNPYLITSPCTSQTISVSGLRVNIFGVVKTPADFNFPNPVTLTKGGSYRLTITVGNYYVLTRTNPVEIGGVKWARTNLQQTGSGVTAPVSFVANPWDYGSRWSWGVRDATNYGPDIYLPGSVFWNDDTANTPCAVLQGGGRSWRLPAKNELLTLINNRLPSGTKVKINGTINTINSYGWAPNAEGTVFGSGNNIVFLPVAGLRQKNGNMESVGSIGYYWSDEYKGTGDAYSLYINNSNKVRVDGSYRNFSLSIRCVQN